MGFSSALQGRQAHDALLARQDAELRLLDIMKRTMQQKAKCDREYAVGLANVAQQGSKIDRIDELQGSHITKAWRVIMDELEQVSRQLKLNAEHLESVCQDRLTQLYHDKRKARKNYQEEHTNISSQFSHISEEVSRKKSEYQKYLELYKVLRTRFEEHYIKSGRSGRKLDDVSDKYKKACRKLHLAHNEYVLLINEATEVEKDFRTILLPGLLEHQQQVQEGFIVQWKNLLLDIVQLGDWSSMKFADIQKRVESNVSSIVPNDEYREFTEKHKTAPASPTHFQFDECLIDENVGKLQPNTLTVDNLTVEWLRTRLGELEASVRECQEKQSKFPLENGSPDPVSAALNGMNGMGGVKDASRKELNVLRCQEKQMLKLVEMIKTALNEIGCEEIPSGCDELSVEQSFIENAVNQEQSVSASANRSLYDEEWFHGVLPREEVVRLLRNEGDFLVRKTTRNDESQTVLSVCWTGHKHFIVQTTSEGHFRFEGPAFPSVQELIMHQYQSELPVTGRSGAVLKKPVLRERWEMSNDDVILLDKIGRGNFGDVYKAKLKSTGLMVAVKTCRMTLPEEQKRKFLQEGRILKQYDHPNIVKLIGICVQKQPVSIVMELVMGGSLLNFLRKNNGSLNTRQLMRMCRDAAAGMQYLESKNCIHRDLAARNCLIGDENTVKISDFGMSREEEEYIVSDGMKQIPIKWTAPEALNFGKYTSLCDVWSYGILVWEIFSKGGTPYSGMSNSRARERIDAGFRLPAPDNTPTEMYTLMLKCWSYEAERRPHFDEIYSVVDALVARFDKE